jgi:hypothetical protein
MPEVRAVTSGRWAVKQVRGLEVRMGWGYAWRVREESGEHEEFGGLWNMRGGRRVGRAVRIVGSIAYESRGGGCGRAKGSCVRASCEVILRSLSLHCLSASSRGVKLDQPG